MKLNRNKIKINKIKDIKNDIDRVSSRLAILSMWELTAEVWSLKDKKNVKRRLQRYITKFIKK